MDPVAVATSYPERDSDLLRLGYQELLNRTAELARAAVAADAAYLLIADEDGLLRMRAAAGHAVQVPAPRAADEAAPRPAGGKPQSFLSVPVQSDGRVTGELTVLAAEPSRFTEHDAASVRLVAERMALPLERARLAEHDRIRRGQISFLAEASDLLAGTLDQQQTIALAAQLVVPRLATWCAILLPDENGEPRPAHVWHADETRSDALRSLLSGLPPPVAAPGESRWQWPLTAVGLPPEAAALTPEAAALAADQAWCFPLLARGRSLGVLVAGRPAEGAPGSLSLDLAEDLSRRVAMAMDNAGLYSEQRRARQALQRSLLPPRLPEIGGLDVAAGYQAAGEGNEVGGDFYDVFAVGPGRWRFAIGDVCGKGLEAAAITGLTRHALRILAREGHDVPAVLARLNALLLDEGSPVPFVTLIHGEIDLTAGPADVSLVCAGHPLPLLLDAGGAVRSAAAAQSLLGVLDDAVFQSDQCRLGPGDVLLCVTDGITERRSGDRLLDDGNGLRRVLAECRGLSAGAVVAAVQQQADDFGSGPAADDMALLVFRGQPESGQ